MFACSLDLSCDSDLFGRVVLFQVEAVKLIEEGKAPRITQPEEGATYECIQKKDNAKVMQTSVLELIFDQA